MFAFTIWNAQSITTIHTFVALLVLSLGAPLSLCSLLTLQVIS
jgi:hypothetical protein